MPKTFRFRYSKLQHPVDRAFVSVQTRFSTIQSYGRIDRICGSSSSNSSNIAVASAIVASTAYTWRLALVGTEEPRFAYNVAAVDRVLRRDICIERRTRERARGCTRGSTRVFSPRGWVYIVHTLANTRNHLLSRVHVRACKRASE